MGFNSAPERLLIVILDDTPRPPHDHRGSHFYLLVGSNDMNAYAGPVGDLDEKSRDDEVISLELELRRVKLELSHQRRFINNTPVILNAKYLDGVR